MFETLKPQPADKILALVQKFKEDPRPQKIDLGVGVYKNAEGVTPVMRAVKAAEHQLWQDETTKSYVGLTGDPAFSDGMIQMVLGDAVPRGAVAAAATPGGTGAVRQAFELARLANPDVRVFVSNQHGRTTCQCCVISESKWCPTAILTRRLAVLILRV